MRAKFYRYTGGSKLYRNDIFPGTKKISYCECAVFCGGKRKTDCSGHRYTSVRDDSGSSSFNADEICDNIYIYFCM